MATEISNWHFGWVTLIATFYLNMVVDGYCIAFGMLRVNLEDEYPDTPPWLTGIMGCMVPTIYLLCAPFCIALTEFYKPPKIVVVASLVSTFGFFCSWASPFLGFGFVFDVIMLGVMQGISSALLYGPSIAVTREYFPKHQHSLASGITTCGSSMGAMVYGLLYHILDDYYGWRGMILMFGGLSLQGLICALAFAESMKPNFSRRRMPVIKASNQPFTADDTVSISDSYHRPADDRDFPAPPCNIFTKIAEEKRRSRLDTNHSLDNYLITMDNQLVRTTSNRSKLSVIPNIIEEGDSDEDGDRQIGSHHPHHHHHPHHSGNNSQIFKSIMWLTSRIEMVPEKFNAQLKRYFNRDIVTKWSFISLLVAASFSICGFYIPTLLLPAQTASHEYGVSAMVENNIVFFFGLSNMVGRIVSSYLADHGLKYGLCTSFSVFIVGHLASSATLILFPLFMHYGDIPFLCFVILYGFFIAPLVTMRLIIVRDMYGEDKANASFGWLLFVQGLFQPFGYILPIALDGISPQYAYTFGGVCFFLTAVFTAITFKPFFKMRRLMIKQDEMKKLNEEELLQHQLEISKNYES